MRHSLSCACATNCFAHAHTIALCMFAQLLCACPIYTSHRHAHAIALHMRKPLLCTCAGQCLAHARPIALHMRKLLLCTCAPHYTAHVHNSQTCLRDTWLQRAFFGIGCNCSLNCQESGCFLCGSSYCSERAWFPQMVHLKFAFSSSSLDFSMY